MRKNFICLFAVVLAIAAVSYTKASKKAGISQWFIYQDDNDGVAFTIDEARNVNNYIEAGTTNVNTLCNGMVSLCAIFAQTDDFHRPIITEMNSVDVQIVTYFNTGVAGSMIRRKP